MNSPCRFSEHNTFCQCSQRSYNWHLKWAKAIWNNYCTVTKCAVKPRLQFVVWTVRSSSRQESGWEEWREGNPGNYFEPTGLTVSFVPNSIWAGPAGSKVSVYPPCHLHLPFHRPPRSSGSCMSPFGFFALSKASDDTGWGSLATINETWHLQFNKSLCNQIFLSEYLSWYCYFLFISHSWFALSIW